MLRLEGVHTYYGTGHILQGVDFEVPQGTITGILGRNGVGKTTTVRTIMGLTPPREGNIYLRDTNIARWSPHRIARAGVAYVPEGRMIFPDLTVVENIDVGKRVEPKTWTVSRLFELFPGLAERKYNKGGQLSGGEQQMLAVARALVTDPEVILLDEPSQGLAPLVVRELSKVIVQLSKENVTVLLVEQNLRLAEILSDRISIMVKGRIVFDAPIDEFQKNKEEIKAEHLML
ncbi:MAG: ABC transporter ATP-binding protein [Rhodospirillales bacterium]|nr:ABC transporter ATP-binding protein [Rhodospirillales bacterium]